MYTYIIVDDEPLIRRGIKKKLQSLDAQIICCGEASNGKAALELIQEQNPDVVITDMKMPIMDGEAFLPILAERYPDKYLIVISGYRDFEYTRHAIRANAIDYLLKPIREADLTASMKKAISLIEEKTSYVRELSQSRADQEHTCYEHDLLMLTNLILGYHTNAARLTSEKLHFTEQIHQFILITLHSEQPLSSVRLQSYLDENGFGDLALYLQHTHTQTLGFLILFVPEKSVIPPMELCRQVIVGLQRLHASMIQEVSYGLSQIQKDLLKLHEAFLQSVSALNQRHPMERNLYYYSDKEQMGMNIRWNEEEKLLFHIEAGMTEQISTLLDQLFDYFRIHPEYSLFDIKQYFYHFTNKVKLMAAAYFDQISANEVNANTQNLLNTLFSLDELHAYYLQFFTNIGSALFPESVYTSKDIVENIKNYITRNYQKDLTVEFIASLFNLNRNYCSSVFRHRTGDTLINYINLTRIEHAKELLTKTDKKMYQVSKAVGYENVKYFFRVFKKHTGISPEQYRKKPLSLKKGYIPDEF